MARIDSIFVVSFVVTFAILQQRVISAPGDAEQASLLAAIKDGKTLWVCQGQKTEYCNPNYVPFENMKQAMLGYDTVTADPFADGGDPGLRSMIFRAVNEDKAGRFVLSQGITATRMTECQSTESATEVSTFKQFAQAASVSGSLNAKLGVKIMGFGGNVGVKLSGSSKSARDFFQSGEGVMMISQASCMLHKIKINEMSLPTFTGTFVKALKKLESAANPTQQKTYFKDFYDMYGTHFISEARFGAKLIIQTKYNKAETSSSQLKESKACGGISLGASYGGFSGDMSVDACSEAKKENKQGSSKATSSSSIISIGSKPKANAMAWSKQPFTKPNIVSLKTEPLTSLFKEIHLKKYGIDANKINSWFLPLMKNFCVEMNKLLPEEEKITCSHPSGCGIDDNCSNDEICRTGVNGGYVCELSPAAKIGKPAVMMVVNSDTTDGTLSIVDVINHGKTCKKMPALPVSATASHNQVSIVVGSDNPKVLAGNNIYTLLPGATAWLESKVFEKPLTTEHKVFQLSGSKVWMIPTVWSSTENPSTIIQYGLSWKGFGHTFVKQTWIDFAVVQIDADNFMFSGGKLLGSLKVPANPMLIKAETITNTFLFNVQTQKWTKTTDMPIAISRHTGGKVTSLKNGKEIVFTGGMDNEGRLSSKTYLYHLKDKTWRVGQDFPNGPDLAFDKPEAVTYADTVLIFAGQSSLGKGQDKIVQFNPDLSMWSTRPNELDEVNGPLLAGAFEALKC